MKNLVFSGLALRAVIFARSAWAHSGHKPALGCCYLIEERYMQNLILVDGAAARALCQQHPAEDVGSAKRTLWS
jgi:hypothetical protein